MRRAVHLYRSWLAEVWCQTNGNIPSYSYGLWVFQSLSQSIPVDWGDLLNSQSEAKENKGRLKLPIFIACELYELVFVDIRCIICHVNLELRVIAFGRQDPARLGSEGASGSRGRIHTECTGQLRTVQTIPRDISHTTRRHAERIDVMKMEPRGGRQIALIASILHPADHLFAKLYRLISSVGLWVVWVYIPPLPNSKIHSEFANRLCPDRIIQPHPVSEVKPCESISWVLRRTPNVIKDVASDEWLRGIGVKLERYVIHIRDSKSIKKASGHALPFVSRGTSADWPVL